MSERIERELLLDASVEDVRQAVTAEDWLADLVEFELYPGGDALFRDADGSVKTGWVEEVHAPERLAFWWSYEGDPATRVELTIAPYGDAVRLRVVETRPLDVLDLVGTPLPGSGGRSYGPALIAA